MTRRPGSQHLLAAAAALAFVFAGIAGAADPTPPPEKATAGVPPSATNRPALRVQELLPLHDGYIRDWLVLTGIPFDLKPGGVDKPDFVDGEAALQPREGQQIKDERLLAVKVALWKRCLAPSNDIPLGEYSGRKAKVMDYAATYLIVPETVTNAVVEFVSSKKDSFLFINRRPAQPGLCVLPQAHNSLLVRIPDDKGDASFWLRILDANKKPLADASVALEPVSEEAEKRFHSYLEPDNAFILFPKPPQRISYVLGLLTPEGAKVLVKAIDYVVNAQQPNGAWSDMQYPDSIGVSALCCMALLAEGNMPRVGPHGKPLDKGIEFLLSSFKEEGIFASKTIEGYGAMYGHALTLLTLLEVCGNTPWRTDLEDKISKGLQAMLACQKFDGGWRYEFTSTGDSDISVTTTVLWVLQQARRYGFTVPKSSINRAIGFIEKCAARDGRFAYRLSGQEQIQPHSGIGIAALYGAGRLDHKFLPAARDLISNEFQRYTVEDLGARRDLMYSAFFASLALYSADYEYWSLWYTKFVQILAHVQKDEGQIYDHRGNKVYTTALAAIILQSPYGYLSIYTH